MLPEGVDSARLIFLSVGMLVGRIGCGKKLPKSLVAYTLNTFRPLRKILYRNFFSFLIIKYTTVSQIAISYAFLPF